MAHTHQGDFLHSNYSSVQGGVTSIGAVLPPVTGVKKFDRGFFTLTLDFARKTILTVVPMHRIIGQLAPPTSHYVIIMAKACTALCLTFDPFPGLTIDQHCVLVPDRRLRS